MNQHTNPLQLRSLLSQSVSLALMLALTLLEGMTHVVLAQSIPSPTQGVTGTGAVEDLEINGQPPSISSPTESSDEETPQQQAVEREREQEIDASDNEQENRKTEEEQLQQERETEFENGPSDFPPPGSDTPGQDSPDSIKIPL
jgi:TolA-binding protein